MTKALLLIDIQNDFCPKGALAVPNGDEVVPIANKLIQLFARNNNEIVGTQDWHPKNHKSFAINNKITDTIHNTTTTPNLFSLITLNGLTQVMWPEHCVQDTDGANFHPDLLDIPVVFCKGEDPEVDSYSGFFDNGKRNKTQLDDFLKSKNVTDLYILGLATDYCVKFTALDAVELGYNVYVVIDGCRGVNINPNDVAAVTLEMINKGIKLINSSDVI